MPCVYFDERLNFHPAEPTTYRNQITGLRVKLECLARSGIAIMKQTPSVGGN